MPVIPSALSATLRAQLPVPSQRGAGFGRLEKLAPDMRIATGQLDRVAPALGKGGIGGIAK